MRLIRIHTIKGKIRLQTGLHIGAGNDTVEIGGVDNPVIKNSMTGAPYIPGSSIKGKMRSLLENTIFAALPGSETLKYISNPRGGSPCGCGKASCPACKIFGAHNHTVEDNLGPTRLLVRDAPLDDEFGKMFKNDQLELEIKYENTIDRLKGTATNPRQMERVPAGVCFQLEMAMREYEGDGPELMDYVFKGLKLLELDALGGCSSRGCGQVRFLDLMLDDDPYDLAGVKLS